MTSEFLNEQLGVFFKCETTKLKLAKNFKNKKNKETLFYIVK